LEYFRQATQIDPRNISLLSDYADELCELRQYSSALRIYDQILEISPHDVDALTSKAIFYQSEANLSEAAMLLARIPSDSSPELFPTQVQQKIYERRFSDAIAMIHAARGRRDRPMTDSLKTFYDMTLADIQQFSGDIAGARLTWQQLKTEIESLPPSKMGSWGTISLLQVRLAVAYAALGEQPKALAIVHEALANQKEDDQLFTARLAGLRARIAIYAGDRNAAVEQLAIVAQNPVDVDSLDYGDLKLNPFWDPLRGDPRFEKIVNSLAPR